MKPLYDARIGDVLATPGATVIATCHRCGRASNVQLSILDGAHQWPAWSAWSPASGASSAATAGRPCAWNGLLLRRRRAITQRRLLRQTELAFQDEPVVAIRAAVNDVLWIAAGDRHQPNDLVQALRLQRAWLIRRHQHALTDLETMVRHWSYVRRNDKVIITCCCIREWCLGHMSVRFDRRPLSGNCSPR